jgi:hypothetical protein
MSQKSRDRKARHNQQSEEGGVWGRHRASLTAHHWQGTEPPHPALKSDAPFVRTQCGALTEPKAEVYADDVAHKCFRCLHLSVTSWSGLDGLSRAGQRDWATVLKALHEREQFNCFEVTANQVIASTMDALIKGEYITTMPRTYPWTDVRLTAKGRAFIGLPE